MRLNGNWTSTKCSGKGYITLPRHMATLIPYFIVYTSYQFFMASVIKSFFSHTESGIEKLLLITRICSHLTASLKSCTQMCLKSAPVKYSDRTMELATPSYQGV